MSIESIADALSQQIELLTELKDIVQKQSEEAEYKPSDFVYLDGAIGSDTAVVVNMTFYRPSVSFVDSQKCSKCDSDRSIKLPDNFNNRTKVCDCFYKNPVYSVQTVKVVKQGDNWYMDDNGVIYSMSAILDTFESCQLDKNTDRLVYRNEVDCQQYCDRRNNNGGK